MAKFRKVYTAFWDDTYIERLSPEDRYFYLFLLTNPLCTECGIYSISLKKICFYTGYHEDAVNVIIKRFQDAGKIKVNNETNEIAIYKKLKYLDRLGKPVIDCLISEVKKVKDINLLHFIKEVSENQSIIDIFNNELTYRTRIVELNVTISRQEEEEEEEKEEEEEENSASWDEKFLTMIVPEMAKIWLKYKPKYFVNKEFDYPALLQLAYKIATDKGWKKADVVDKKEKDTLQSWDKIVQFCVKNTFFTKLTLDTLSTDKMWQKLKNDMTEQNVPQINGAARGVRFLRDFMEVEYSDGTIGVIGNEQRIAARSNLLMAKDIKKGAPIY